MTDQEILRAMIETLKPIQQQLVDMQQELRQVSTTQDTMQQELRQVALAQENEVLPKLNLVYENQVQIIEEHKAMSNLEKKVEVLEDDVFALKAAFKELKRA